MTTSTFLIIGIVATVLLLLAFLLDGLFDWMHIDFLDGAVGSATIFAFIAVFGYAGSFIEHNFSLNMPMTILISIGVGLLAGLLVGAATRYFENSESGIVNDENIIGRTASVVLPIPAGGYGKIQVMNSGHLMEVSALSNDPIPRGTQVIIEAITGPGVVKVRINETTTSTSTT